MNRPRWRAVSTLAPLALLMLASGPAMGETPPGEPDSPGIPAAAAEKATSAVEDGKKVARDAAAQAGEAAGEAAKDDIGEAAKDDIGEAAKDDIGEAAKDDIGEAASSAGAASEPPAEPAAAEPADAPAPDPTATPESLFDEDHPSRLRITAWLGVAATVALLTTGAIFSLAAQERADEYSRQLLIVGPDNQPQPYTPQLAKQLADLKSEGERFEITGITLMSVSGAVAIASTIMFIVDHRRSRSDEPAADADSALSRLRVAPSVSPRHAGVGLSYAF